MVAGLYVCRSTSAPKHQCTNEHVRECARALVLACCAIGLYMANRPYYTGAMQLAQWVETQDAGVLTRLQLQTGLSYTAILRAVHRRVKPLYQTAHKIAAATNYVVSVEEICASPLPPAPKRKRKRAPALTPKQPANGKKPPKRKRAERPTVSPS